MSDPPWAIVVTWDSRDDVLACLDALARSKPRPHVVLVDNASRDGTVEAVTAQCPQVEIIAHARNLHFAAGANAGLRRARAAGYRVVGVPAARVDHFGGRAWDRRLLLQTYLRGRNWLWCFARHAPPEQRLRAVIAVAAYRLPRLALGSALWYIARKLRPRGRRVSL